MKIKRNILLNPGPATTTDTVKMAQVVPDICPREKEFVREMEELRSDLLKIVHGDSQSYTTVLFCGSGTICMDACLNSLLPDNKKILIVNNGFYSSRAVEACRCYQLPFVDLKFDYNQLPDLQKVEMALKENTDIGMVYITHCETGTGILNPIRELGKLAHKYGALLVADTISTYGMITIDMGKDHVDFCMGSAQKGLMAMTGLSFVIGNKSHIEQSEKYTKKSYYSNLYLQYKAFAGSGEMRFTPPVQTVYAARQGVKEFFAEGEYEKYARHRKIYEEINEQLENMGFRHCVRKEWQSGVVACFDCPNDNNWDFQAIHDYCYSRGFTIYPGKLSGIDTFRVCTFGAIDAKDIISFAEVFREALISNHINIPVSYES